MDNKAIFFKCSECGDDFNNNIVYFNNNISSLRYSRREYVHGKPYCKTCATKIRGSINSKGNGISKALAVSFGLKPYKCKHAGTCEILKAHHTVMSDDPERLTSEFMIGLICGKDGVKRYKEKRGI